jgi:hypothetical protein
MKIQVYDEYTLFAAHGTTYLTDMEGNVVNTRPIASNPSLLENGNIVWEYDESRRRIRSRYGSGHPALAGKGLTPVGMLID